MLKYVDWRRCRETKVDIIVYLHAEVYFIAYTVHLKRLQKLQNNYKLQYGVTYLIQTYIHKLF
jgi:hypothetical protein